MLYTTNNRENEPVSLPNAGYRSSIQSRQFALVMITNEDKENTATGTIIMAYFLNLGRRAEVTYKVMEKIIFQNSYN